MENENSKDELGEADPARRRDQMIKRMLATPPQPGPSPEKKAKAKAS
jgi:hypothetical protein